MSFASRYHNLLHFLRLPALLAVVLMGVTYGWFHTRLPQVAENAAIHDDAIPAWPTLPAAVESDWSVFRGDGDGVALGQPDFAKAFRFAGTFFLSGAGGAEIRKAVLSIVDEGRQVIASEGDVVTDVTVARIFQDRVVLQRGAETAELRLSFASAGLATGAASDTNGEDGHSVSRLGEQIRDGSWVLKRDALMAYYNELLDAPERLLQVFDSLKPLYNGEGKIEGYQLGIEGEREFFAGVGFREGDVVRKVNSLEMTSRNRAEFFIRQVVDNKLSAVVIDIERGGASRRLVYQVR
jgi:type II secretory pathway component PulC